MKTIPIYDITEEDAKFWGTSKAYTIHAQIYGGGFSLDAQGQRIWSRFTKEETRNLPQFTWADVKNWKDAIGRANAPKIWTGQLVFTWTPTYEFRSVNDFKFIVNSNNSIEEYGPVANSFVGKLLVHQP